MEIVVAIIIDGDMSLLVPVVKGDAGVKTLTEAVFDISDVGRSFFRYPASSPASLFLAGYSCEVGRN